MIVGLMQRCHVVVMDLRGFNEKNKGCQFEIEALGRITRGYEVTFLVDNTTDMDLLIRLLQRVFGEEPTWRIRDVKRGMVSRDWERLVDELLERRIGVV